MNRNTINLLFLLLGATTMAQTTEEYAAEFERARKITISYLEAMPADKYGFRPNDEVRSFAEQMLHASQGTFNLVSNGSGADRRYTGQNLEKDPTLQSKDAVIKIVNESYDFAIAALMGMQTVKMTEKVKAGPFDVTRAGWLLKAFEHVTHHRGQCAVYLRLAGITPPQYQLFD